MEQIRKRSENLKVRGDVFIEVRSPNGVTRKIKIKNLVGNYGTGHMATLLSGGASTLVQYIALGTGGTPETVTDTTLGTELYRKVASVELGVGVDANKVTYSATWTAGSAQGTLREAGLFDDPTAGNMFSRTTFADLVIGVADTLIVTWVVSFVGT